MLFLVKKILRVAMRPLAQDDTYIWYLPDSMIWRMRAMN